MSTNNDNDPSILAPNVSTEPRIHRVNSHAGGSIRSGLGSMDNIRDALWMESYGGDRNLFQALGYVQEPKYQHYRARYERTDTAHALIDKLPKKAWAQPRIVDTGAEEEESEFEKEINNFLSGDYTEEDPIKVFERASRMERLGNYSLIFLGLNDDAVSGGSAEDLAEEVDEASLESMDTEECISYLTPYDEARVDENDIKWNDHDPSDPRFNKPESYGVDFGDERPTSEVHWSRVIHVVGNVFDNEFKSPSVLKQSLNRVDDIEKILGGSAEGYWRSAYQGLVISPPEIGGQMTEFRDDGEELHGQIERYINNFSREIFTGAEVDPIDVSAQDPNSFLETQYKDLSAGHDIPQSILMGNETGERATEEDRQMWHERVGEFRIEYCFSDVLAPFIQRFIDLNVVPEPLGEWRCEWPPLDERSAQEEANIIQTMSNAIATGTGGNPMAAVTIPEFRQKVLGWKPERGAEVEGEIDESEMEPVTAEELDLDVLDTAEGDDRVNEQFLRLHESRLTEETKVRTKDGLRGIIVEVLTKSFDAEGVSVTASEDEPKYVVVTESEDKPWDFYGARELDVEDWDSGIENPVKDLEESEGEDRENLLRVRIERALAAFNGRENVAGDGHFTWPRSWRESEKPARLIALDAWVSMGGSVSACMREMRGEVVDPGRFCADFADRLYMWDYWRGDSWLPGE